ncbi:hypothetical protein KSP40_PGU018445 [Platanthera guangdongensis]|uniref:Uncharacterized protein n=1 Tax=Platanthera guangdongensis TaxID=2320717 RepID=A0ABR2LEJ0_9ASPA
MADKTAKCAATYEQHCIEVQLGSVRFHLEPRTVSYRFGFKFLEPETTHGSRMYPITTPENRTEPPVLVSVGTIVRENRPVSRHDQPCIISPEQNIIHKTSSQIVVPELHHLLHVTIHRWSSSLPESLPAGGRSCPPAGPAGLPHCHERAPAWPPVFGRRP